MAIIPTYAPYFGVHVAIPGQAPANLLNQTAGTENPTYKAMIHSIDQSVGQILEFLKITDDRRNAVHKLIDNTTVRQWLRAGANWLLGFSGVFS